MVVLAFQIKVEALICRPDNSSTLVLCYSKPFRDELKLFTFSLVKNKTDSLSRLTSLTTSIF
jgi:hypothetical protein